MIWRKRELDDDRPDLEQTRAALEQARAQREEAVAAAKHIRAEMVKNNFAANTFQLIAPRGRR